MKHVDMNEVERAEYDAARDIPEDQGDGYETDHEMDINDVLDGTTRLDFSHAGGEFQHIMEEELHQQSSYVSSFL
jgi:hypothetical protein